MLSAQKQSDAPSVAVVGGGLAGMTAALALADRGLKVTLLEAHRRLGGRIAPIDDALVGQPIDFCPHVTMGCCTNLAHLLRRIGAAERWQRFDKLHFFGHHGKRYKFAASRWLPAPLHLLPALLRQGYLSLADRLAIAQALWRLARADADSQRRAIGSQFLGTDSKHLGIDSQPLRIDSEHLTVDAESLPPAEADHQHTIARWLVAQRQSPEAILRFWAVVLHSALSERLDGIDLQTARKVFVDGFLASRQAWQVHTPASSLWQAVCQPLAEALQQRNVEIRCGSRAGRIEGDGRRATAVVLADGSSLSAQFVILAVAWHQAAELLAEPLRAAVPQLQWWAEMGGCPIAAVHLWFDRPITNLPNAILTSQCGWWVFNKGCGELAERCDSAQRQARPCQYYQVVISAAYELASRTAEDILTLVLDVLKRHFPAARDAALLHWRALVHRRAVFGCRPGVESLRPPQQTQVANLVLAGDWTSTGWPATMESAVRSGYAAAEAVLAALGMPQRVVIDDLPRGPLARLLLG